MPRSLVVLALAAVLLGAAPARAQGLKRITISGVDQKIDPDAKTLDLGGTAVTNAGLKELAALKNLTALDLRNTWVTDAGLKELAALKGLRELTLRYTPVTDAGMKELAALPNLTTLNLGATAV
ncbi:MAG TPA: hypothetical protein VGE74_24875, partial [Gemmata sp.]